MTHHFDLIVWDWDGTLADSTALISTAIMQSAQALSLPVLPRSTVNAVIGLDLKQALRTLYGTLSVAQLQQLMTGYYQHYYTQESKVVLFEGVSTLVQTLYLRGFKQAVATGKGRRELDLALAHSGLGAYFQATCTPDECHSKPHPQMLLELMDALMILPQRTLMIGDTSYDLEMAKRANVQAVAVSFGAQTASAWHNLSYLARFDRFVDLADWLLREVKCGEHSDE